MSDTVILVPRRPDGGQRDRLWAFCRERWEAFGWPIVEGVHDVDEGPFNRSAAINRAAATAGNWSYAFVVDGDVIVGDEQVADALDRCRRHDVLTFAYCAYFALNRRGTDLVLRGDRGDWQRHARYVGLNMTSSVEVVSRDLWDEVGGFDERFVGWGWEDVAFMLACGALRGDRVDRVHGEVWHLHHGHSVTDRSRAIADANEARCRAYIDARYDRDAMLAVIADR